MRQILQLCVAVVAAATFICAAGAAPAARADGWVLPARTVAPAANGPGGAVAGIDAAGDAIVVWTDDDARGTQSVVVATRPAGGAWSAPVPLATNAWVDAPALAVAPDGVATVVWTESADGTAYAVESAQVDLPAGTHGSAQTLTPAAAVQPLTQVRLNAAGDAIATWVEYDDGNAVNAVRAAVRTSRAWGAATTLSDPGYDVAYSRPQVAPDATGGALVAWTAQQVAGPFDHAVQTSTRSGGGWSAAVDLTSSADAITPVHLAGDADGDTAATWFQGSPSTLWGALRTSGTWTVDDVSDDVAPACEPTQTLGADAGGGATVVWKAQSTEGLESVRLTTGGWESPQTVFAPSDETVQDAQIDDGTVAFVVSDTLTDAPSVLAVRRTGSGWSAPALLASAPGGRDTFSDPLLATDAAGDVLAAWTVTDPLGARTVAAAGFQAAPPQFTAVGVPGTGTAGAALSLSASAESVFASIAQVSWDFGDGTPAEGGGSVSHTYAQAGDYTVTVTATDTAGNATTTRRQVTVAPAEVPPPTPPTTPTTPTTPVPPPARPPVTPPTALVRPAIAVRGGVLRLGPASRTVTVTVRNPNALTLTGRAQLTRPRSGRRPALLLADKRAIAFGGARRSTLTLRLSDTALRTLRTAPGHRLHVQVALRLRAADGRGATAALGATLDATARFPSTATHVPLGRMAC